MIDVGAGTPLVLVPGIQGRWEWMEPSIEALARDYRVITASLPGEPGVGTSFDADADFDVFVRHLDDVLDASGVASAIICGVSFGGLIALALCSEAQQPRPRIDPRIDARTPLEDESDPGTICKVADSRESAVRDRRRSPRMARDVRAASASALEAVGLREHRMARRPSAGSAAPYEPPRTSCRAPGLRSRLHVRHSPRR